MVTSNILQRVFLIKFGNSTGTCFTIDINQKQYFVTAKHVVKDLKDNDIIELYYQGGWKSLPIKLVGHHLTADVTVFSAGLLLPAGPAETTLAGIILGQDIFFLGFPLGLMSEVGEINRDFPLPLVKKGCLSAINMDYIFIDGHNNRGFSGGPVVFKKENSKDFIICGIIHGYMQETGDIMTVPTDTEQKLISLQNSGIMKAYSIKNAVDLITNNPIGLSILK